MSKRCASHKLLPCVALAVMMAGCVLLCSTFKGRRMHCKHERAANASLGSHSSQRRSDALRTSLLPSCVALAVMMAGCGLLCSTFKGRRMHCKHEGATHWTLRCNGTAPASGFHKLVQHVISDFAVCLLGKGEEAKVVPMCCSLWSSLHHSLDARSHRARSTPAYWSYRRLSEFIEVIEVA